MVLKTKWSQTWNSAEMERAHPQHSTEQVAPDGVCELLLLMVLWLPPQAVVLLVRIQDYLGTSRAPFLLPL